MYNIDSKVVGWTLAVVFGITTAGLAIYSAKQAQTVSNATAVMNMIRGAHIATKIHQKEKEDEEAE